MATALDKVNQHFLQKEKLARVKGKIKKAKEDQTRKVNPVPDNLYQFIPYLTEAFWAPRHLAPIIERLTEAESGTPTKFCFSVPPGHLKTSTLLYYCAWYLYRNPTHRVIYATSTYDLAQKASRTVRQFCERLGMTFAVDANKAEEWELVQGGGLLAKGTGQGIAGRRAELIIVDDPFASRAEAESQLQRDKIYEWFTNDILTREVGKNKEKEFSGTSVFVVHTRWHTDDLIGRLSSKTSGLDAWTYVNLPALDGYGLALCPDLFDETDLNTKRVQLGEYSFSSLYQGQPTTKNGKVFVNNISFYLPIAAFQEFTVTYGVDVAYGAKSKSDYSVLLEIRSYKGNHQIASVVRAQCSPTQFVEMIKAQLRNNPGPLYWYTGGQEGGIAELFKTLGVTINTCTAHNVGNKFIRAQPVAAAWAAQKISVPYPSKETVLEMPWINPFLDEIQNFTGNSDPHDDQVDALAAAYNAVANNGTLSYKTIKAFYNGADDEDNRYILPRRM